ncbi:MAG TPA: sigma-70 family RNA polymerase sigma factor [Blastocatellia bacterium]|nr:sigma-70 family RNA polymerase sigma factor [Blastocatellia bacterium]
MSAFDTLTAIGTDEELVVLVSRGDHSAFELLVKRYQEQALRTAFRFVGDRYEAEDLAQEAFVRIYQRAGSYQPIASFKTWFYQILGNLCRDWIKRKKPVCFDECDDPVAEDDPDLTLERKQRQDAVLRAITGLPTNQRLALVMCHYEGLSYDEAARSLSLSRKSIESLLVRAKRSLRRDLAHLVTESRD